MNRNEMRKGVRIYSQKPLQAQITFTTVTQKDKPKKKRISPSLISGISNFCTVLLTGLSLLYSIRAFDITTETIKQTDKDRARQDSLFYLQNTPIIAVTYFGWNDFLSNNDQSSKISIQNFGTFPARIISVKRAILLSDKMPSLSEIDSVISLEKDHPFNLFIVKNEGFQDLNLTFDKEKKDKIINDLKVNNKKNLVTILNFKWFNELTRDSSLTTVLVGSTGTRFEESFVLKLNNSLIKENER